MFDKAKNLTVQEISTAIIATAAIVYSVGYLIRSFK